MFNRKRHNKIRKPGFFSKLYHGIMEIVCVDTESKKVSNSKLWSNVSSAALVWAFLHCYDKGADYWLIFGGLLLGSHLSHRLINNRSGITLEDEPEAKDPPSKPTT